MSTVAQVTPVEPELLSWTEICARWPDQYVVLIDEENAAPGSPEIRAARVIGHGATDDAAYEPIREVRSKYPLISVRFTGTWTEPLIRPSLVIDDETLEILREPLTRVWRVNDDGTRVLLR